MVFVSRGSTANCIRRGRRRGCLRNRRCFNCLFECDDGWPNLDETLKFERLSVWD